MLDENIGEIFVVNNIGLLWITSGILPVLTVSHWRLWGSRAGIYMLYLSGIAFTYPAGMTLRHFEVGPLVVCDHLPDLGFVVWQSLVLFIFLSAIQAKRRPQTRYSFTYALRLLGVACFVILTVTLLDELTSSLDWIDMAAFFTSVGLATLPAPWILQRSAPA